MIIKVIMGFCIIVFSGFAIYWGSRIFWKAGTDQVDSVLNNKLKEYLPKSNKEENDNKK